MANLYIQGPGLSSSRLTGPKALAGTSPRKKTHLDRR